MLVISVRNGDNTTITTPNGETISIVMLSQDAHRNEARLGISAPDHYQILRDKLRKQLQIELQNTPIFKVSSANQPSQIIADSSAESAIRYYQRQYPNSEEVHAEEVADRYHHRWYKTLEDNWMRDSELPVSVDIGEY